MGRARRLSRESEPLAVGEDPHPGPGAGARHARVAGRDRPRESGRHGERCAARVVQAIVRRDRRRHRGAARGANGWRCRMPWAISHCARSISTCCAMTRKHWNSTLQPVVSLNFFARLVNRSLARCWSCQTDVDIARGRRRPGPIRAVPDPHARRALLYLPLQVRAALELC
jgi:hypothetical protein